MQVLRLLVTFFLVQAVHGRSQFRFGAVLSTTGNTSSMAEAKNGYKLFVDTINAQSNGKGFLVKGKPGTRGYYFKYEFLWREDESDEAKHAEQLKELIADGVDFIGGSHPTYAKEEMQIANSSDVLNYHCCVGPDHLYEQGYERVFGITASNKEYTKLTVRTLALQQVDGLAIVYENSNVFTNTTCEAAIGYSKEADAVREKENSKTLTRTFDRNTRKENFFNEVAQEIKAEKLRAVIACVFPEEGKLLVNAIHDISYPLKALFITTGPTKQDWVDDFDSPFRVEDILSSAQWHHDMQYEDAYFNSTAQYVSLYQSTFDGHLPTYISAGASAVGISLTDAIKEAFKNCDISKTKGDAHKLLYDSSKIKCDEDDLGDSGYERVIETLKLLEMKTFYGEIKFNHNRRNEKLDPVTTQVFLRNDGNGNVKREIEAVLPVGEATEVLHYPAKNHYNGHCSPGHYFDKTAFLACKPCEAGESSEGEDATHCDSCPVGKWTNESAQSSCFHCPFGTHTEVRGATNLTDCKCKSGYFNADGQLGAKCDPCPVGAECAGGISPPIPMAGYWVNATRRAQVYQCDPPSVCKGGENLECEKGHTGRLCALCESTYFSALQGCYKCPNSFMIIFMCIALLVCWYVINVTVSRSVTSLEMILAWAQLANIIGDVNLNWTDNVTTMFGVANLLDFDVDFLEPSCLVNWGFKENFITQLLLPFVMSLMAAIGYFGSAAAFVLVRRKWVRVEGRRNGLLSIFFVVPEDQEQLQEKWDATVATFLASVDVTYVTIAKYCLDVFHCQNISGISVLTEAPDVVCGTADHKVLIGLSIFGIVFYVAGYLLYIVWKLYDLQNRRAFSIAVNIRRFGFVYVKFELPYFFTPAVNLIRKLFFVCVLVTMKNPAFQVGALAIIINISLMLHVYTAPYVDTHFDVLQSFLLIALMFESFGGLMFYSENLPSANRRILEWMVIGTLLILTVVFVAILAMEILRKYQIRWLKKAHKKFIRGSLGHCPGSINTLKQLVNRQLSLREVACQISSRGTFSDRNEDWSFELLETFDPAFVYTSIRKDPDSIQKWDKLSTMLKEYMSDQSHTSYLSIDPVAKFWRKLVDRFPEILDFLAAADPPMIEKFKDFATNLYQNFYLTKKLTPLPLMKILNWRDYAPMAQWLAIAPREDRRFFLEYVAQMFRLNGDVESGDLLESRAENGGHDPMLESRECIVKKSVRKNRILDCVANGSNPFFHPASDGGSAYNMTDKSATQESTTEVVCQNAASDPCMLSTPVNSSASLHDTTNEIVENDLKEKPKAESSVSGGCQGDGGGVSQRGTSQLEIVDLEAEIKHHRRKREGKTNSKSTEALINKSVSFADEAISLGGLNQDKTL